MSEIARNRGFGFTIYQFRSARSQLQQQAEEEQEHGKAAAAAAALEQGKGGAKRKRKVELLGGNDGDKHKRARLKDDDLPPSNQNKRPKAAQAAEHKADQEDDNHVDAVVEAKGSAAARSNNNHHDNDDDKEDAEGPGFEHKNHHGPEMEEVKDDKLDAEEQKRRAANRQCLAATKKTYRLSRPEPVGLWFETQLDAKDVLAKRSRIKQRIVRKKNKNDNVDTGTLEQIFKGYDAEFFGNGMQQHLASQKTRLVLTMSLRNHGNENDDRKDQEDQDNQDHGYEFKRDTAGFCELKGDQATIALHPGLNQLQFGRQGEEVNGIIAYDLVECVQLVLEHELIHLIMQVFLRQFATTHGKQFQTLARGLFGHTLFTHAIGHGTDRVKQEEEREAKFSGCRVGDVVAYQQQAEAKFHYSHGIVINKAKQHVALIHDDGTVADKVPYSDLQLLVHHKDNDDEDDSEGDDGSSDDDDSDSDEDEEKKDQEGQEAAAPPKKPPVVVLQRLQRWSRRFVENKKKAKKEASVSFVPGGQGKIHGTVVGKKALTAQVALAGQSTLVCAVPYQYLVL